MKFISLIILLAMSIAAVGQYQFEPHNQYHFQNKPQGFMTSLPPAAPGQIGSFYIDEEFSHADIYLKDSTKLDDVFVRVDARANAIEIKHDHTIKVLPAGRMMLAIVTTSSGVTKKFINGDILKITDNPFRGIVLQVHYEGNISLLSRAHAIIKRANADPNPMSNMGIQRDDELLLETHYLITGKDTFIDASQPRSKFKRELVSSFGEDVETLAKQTNPKDPAELTILVRELDNRSRPK